MKNNSWLWVLSGALKTLGLLIAIGVFPINPGRGALLMLIAWYLLDYSWRREVKENTGWKIVFPKYDPDADIIFQGTSQIEMTAPKTKYPLWEGDDEVD